MDNLFHDMEGSFETTKKASESETKQMMARNKGGLECNICLDLVHDPVVTLCGHLYCWACIYKWIIQYSQTNNNNNMNNNIISPASCCPVCKSEILLETSLVPLYSRGQTTKVAQQSNVDHLGLIVPKRPLRVTSSSSSSSTVTLEEAVFARIFGISRQIPNSYHHMSGSGDHTSSLPSLLETDKWFRRVCSFLCCFILVCLVLF
ncbi:E3 ubiquitin-protein ligase RMA1H1-like [Impatiens glandulifera]|uniref:E3 ubiquitin-protein ligase RMA1H1-like n=1 Tax=Impatiens glandulifera TaxID=253017 RepID=UPI001FB10E4A|nr:E3 ubiquitin-protein ligase RMA1H1-like [Impatiens glandulifera]